MKAIFSGYYGAKNSGDDAFVEVAAWGSKKYWQSTEQLFFASELPETITSTSHYFAHKNHFNFARAIKDITLSDVFASAGGSTFHSSLTKTDLRSYAKLKKKIGFSGKIGAIGISLGPYPDSNAEKNIVSYLKSLDFLALRDNRSYEMAASYNLPYEPIKAFDLAALLPEVYNYKDDKKKDRRDVRTVGISICNYESYTNGDLKKEEKRNQFVESVLLQLKKNKDVKFRFFIFNGNSLLGDEQLTLNMINKLNGDGKLNYEIIPYTIKVQETFNAISECDVVLSTRLHASIFACYSNTPFFLLEYHRKCTDFLDDIGQSSQYRLFDGDVEVLSTSKAIEKIIFDKDIVAPKNIQETINRSRLNFISTL